ncbi:VOC family protein [Paenibacillus sp. CF384]|uniref:VOC family protein n=1 Tax=Paenibacillus sp. CF384 TaxID=1884382 RepID=UPI00089D848F|nr:VOC family protein [Paenibacillus sp. CF384]SDX07962.1 Catechol 2,3-dioxygenase [Paenibacillus sp. CF384]
MIKQSLEFLDHIQIPVIDLEQSIEWYTTHLGFNLQGKPDHDDMAFLSLSSDQHARPIFLLWKTNGNESMKMYFSKREEKMPVLCFRTKDAHALREQLEEANVEIANFADEGWAFCLDFYDINGNLINATEYK